MGVLEEARMGRWKGQSSLLELEKIEQKIVIQIIITPQTSYAAAMMIPHTRRTVLPNFVEQMLSVKNDVEIKGMKNAYLRDGAAFVCPRFQYDHAIYSARIVGAASSHI